MGVRVPTKTVGKMGQPLSPRRAALAEATRGVTSPAEYRRKRNEAIYRRWVELGMNTALTAQEFGMPKDTVYRVTREEEERGEAQDRAALLEGQAKRMREASGNVADARRLVAFLFVVMRDHLPVGKVEDIMGNIAGLSEGSETIYSNGWLALYAKDLAFRLTGWDGGVLVPGGPLEPGPGGEDPT